MRKAIQPLMRWSNTDVTTSVLKASMRAFDFEGSPADLIALPQPKPNEFESPELFRDSYWLAEMWSKFPFDLGIDREAVALATFHEYERRCGQSNKVLCDLWTKPIPERYRSILRHARSLLEHLFSGFTVNEIIDHVHWGPGASTSMSRVQATPQNKWVFGAHLTQDVLPYFYAYQRYTGWIFDRPEVVRGNKVTTVPKNAKTDRTIAVEPDWNSFFQLGMGGAIRSRLQRRVGLLRPCAQEINQLLAKAGSSDGFLCTIDLKGASDTVSLALVEALIPEDVLSHLLALRSPEGEVNGEWVTYEKISSMGNGYTFELETALFWAICKAASGHAVVFGDDIVVPASSFQLVVEILQLVGFEVNLKKSHYDSPFRESCGGHFFKGRDVTPPYVKKPCVGPYRISLANRISHLSDNGSWRDSLLREVHRELTHKIPKALHGPIGVDGVVHCELYGSHPEYSSRYQTFTGPAVIERYVTDPAPVIGAYIQALFGESGYTQWMKSPGIPVISIRRWWSAWHGPSPWS